MLVAAWHEGRRGVAVAALGLVLGHASLALTWPGFGLDAYEIMWGHRAAGRRHSAWPRCETRASSERLALGASQLRFERAPQGSARRALGVGYPHGQCLLLGALPGADVGADGPMLSPRIAEWFDRVHPEEMEPLPARGGRAPARRERALRTCTACGARTVPTSGWRRAVCSPAMSAVSRRA